MIDIGLRYYSRYIEMTISVDGTASITKEITDINGYVDEELISKLREIADDLEYHNNVLESIEE